jgi:predicted  nucleic acid-binding Zn-ribbon protein
MNLKVNFTREHLAELTNLATDMLFNNETISGLMGTKINVHDLFHNTSLQTLTTLHANLKKAAINIENLDEWSLDPYQQRKLNKTKSQQRFVNLLIGYKKYSEEIDANKAKLQELKAKAKELQASTMTPQQQLDAINAEIAAAEKVVGGLDEAPAAPVQENQATA